MNPIHLRTFLAVRKHLNYTRAAEELYLSQPAVSRQIRQLEQKLKTPLFEQIGKSLHLTDAGRTLALEAEKILGAMERAGEVVRAHLSAERGSLRIGASTTPGLYMLPDGMGRFQERFPAVEFHYVVENSSRIEQMIIRNELDLGFVGARLTNDDLLMEPVGYDEIVCFAGPSHRLASRKRIDPRSLDGEIWVMREKGSATRLLIESWLAGIGGRTGRTIELGSPETVKALVAAGIGFSFMSSSGLRDELRAGRFKKLPVSRLNLGRQIYLVRHKDKHTSPAMNAFLEMVKTTFARIVKV
jgi:LysR family transcriptional regulator, transcriptional activator of the cysJI operon